MKFEIFQIIDSEKDTNRIRFESYERTIKWAGKFDPTIYDRVHGGIVNAGDASLEGVVERIYMESNTGKFRMTHPRGHTLSMSDVVVVDGTAFFIDDIGVRDITDEWFVS